MPPAIAVDGPMFEMLRSACGVPTGAFVSGHAQAPRERVNAASVVFFGVAERPIDHELPDHHAREAFEAVHTGEIDCVMSSV